MQRPCKHCARINVDSRITCLRCGILLGNRHEHDFIPTEGSFLMKCRNPYCPAEKHERTGTVFEIEKRVKKVIHSDCD